MTDFLFENVSFSIHTGERIGLLGYNGSGKSTLLNIIKGNIKEYDGNIERWIDKIFFMEQEDFDSREMSVQDYLIKPKAKIFKLWKFIEEMEEKHEGKPIEYAKKLNEFEEIGGYKFLQKTKALSGKFGFPEELLKRQISSFSGGERKLLHILSGFLADFELFLLDEPTNYLDDRARDYLMEAVDSSSAAFLIVSHDRWFLDKTVRKIFEIERGTLKEYTGNYSVFINTKETELKKDLRKKVKIESEIKQLKKVERSYKNWGKKKEKEKIGTYDKGFIGKRAAKLMKKSKQAKERTAKKIEELEKTEPWIEKWHDFKFEEVDIHTGASLTVSSLSKSINNKKLFDKLNFNITWGEKVAILGANGSGKTTLIRTLLRLQKPDSGDIIWDGKTKTGYMPQESTDEYEDKRVTEIFPKEDLDFAMTLLGCLKVPGENFDKKFKELSEGQKKKVKLVQIIIEKPNFLILDEPTTHLDYMTVERLEKALIDFSGTILLISHDRFLRERVTERSINLS